MPPKQIESLSRGLRVLEALQIQALPLSLSRLHAETQIPKASLLSILYTLDSAGLVEEVNAQWAVSSAWLLKIQIYSTNRLLALETIRKRERRIEDDQGKE